MKILLFHAHQGDPLSFLIKALERTAYCHAAVLIDTPEWVGKFKARYESVLTSPAAAGDTQFLITEQYWPHVRLRYLKRSELAEIDVFDVLGWSEENENAGLAWAQTQIDAHVAYGVQNLFRFIAPGRALLGEATDDSYKKYSICSQYAFNIARMGGVRLLNCHDYECSPDKLPWSPLAVQLAPLIVPASPRIAA